MTLGGNRGGGGIMDHLDHLNERLNTDNAAEAIARLERSSEQAGSPKEETGLFKLPRCAASPWGRVAVFLAYRKGSLPAIGTYNHIMLVLAPATPEVYLHGPRAEPDGAFLYELTGTAGEFLKHATVGKTISTTRVTPLGELSTLEKLKFMYLGFSECNRGLGVSRELDLEEDEGDAEESDAAAELTDSIVTSAATAPVSHQQWRTWEDNSGLAFVHPWHHTMLELKLRHDELFKTQRRSGVPFAAAIGALFPGDSHKIGHKNHKRYNFATYNCGHYVRELLTAGFGMVESVAQTLMLDNLKPSGLPRKWHSHSPFAVVNPKLTEAFEVAAGFGQPEGVGAARMRCLAKPTEAATAGRKDLLNDNFACYKAWQEAEWEYDGDTGSQEVQGGYKQFFDEHYGEIWVAASAGSEHGKELKQKLNALMTTGEKLDAGQAAARMSPMGSKVVFRDAGLK